MTQDQCLQLPHHFTHDSGDGLGMVCYPGDVAWIDLSNPNNPQDVHFHTNGGTAVPEPGSWALFAVAALVALVFNPRSRCRYPR